MSTRPHKQKDPERRRMMQHARYMRKRDEILAYQKTYRETHREEIRERHRQWRSERTVKKLRLLYHKPPTEITDILD